MSQEPRDPRPPSAETEMLVEYPAVSRLAVVSVVLAIGSVGALFSPLMICSAVAGAALAVVALWSLARADPPLLGRKAALLALVLSLLFGAWGATWRTVREHVICIEAQQRADQWLQLVRAGRLSEAHQLHLSRSSRQAPGADLADFYKKTREVRLDMDRFFDAPPLRQIIAAGQQGQLRFLQCDSLQKESYAGLRTDVATLRYALDYQRDGRPQTLTFLVFITRTVEGEKAEANWELRSLQFPQDGR
ncbi:MAG TPA: hypothetical protein PLF81_07050 [Candidatus Anammoximicrobium sp.]|nr:hypothetical protein [Candidatus Anammoximicrobium sp.]